MKILYRINLSSSLLTLLGLVHVAPSLTEELVLKKIGVDVRIPFPNDETMLGISGLTFDNDTNIWTLCGENIPGSPVDIKYPNTSQPRIYHMKLDFISGDFEFVKGRESQLIQPSTELKLEDIELVVSSSFNNTTSEKYTWVVSESNSKPLKTNKFFSNNFGAPDLSSFDKESLSNSKLLRIDRESGTIIEEANIPEFAQWNSEYNWESSQCVGSRPFQGFNALTSFQSSDLDYDYMMAVASRASFYQDGSSPTNFVGSGTRILIFGIKNEIGIEGTTDYLKSFRYDTSQLTLKKFQMGASHFNALTGIIAFNETSFFISELEALFGFGTQGQKVVNRIFFVNLNVEDTIDHCLSLLSCNISAPSKKLVWERQDDKQLDGLAWGPIDDDGKPTVAITFDNNEKFGAHIELLSLDIDAIAEAPNWMTTDNRDHLKKNRLTSVLIAIVLVILAFLAQFAWKFYMAKKNASNQELAGSDIIDRSSSFTYAHYAMCMAMINSFLVGGVTFGYSGVVLILRKEGVYADSCACGSFCAKQKESLALISTLGFASAVGCRLFVGFLMDWQGPKITAVLSSLTCLAGFILLSITDNEGLSSMFLTIWVLLSVGGSGLHLTGFHFTNLFKGQTKKVASAGIDAAFGASSSILPIMQIFNQYYSVSLQSMARVYAGVILLMALNNFFVQPWSIIEAGVTFQPGFNIFSKGWWKTDTQRKSILSLLSRVQSECVKPQFWGETIVYTVSFLQLTYYISISAQMLYEKGDVPFTSNPNDWSDYIFTRMSGWFNALGLLWFPIVEHIVKKLSWPTCYLILVITNLVALTIFLINSLELQVLGFVIQSFGRLLLFSIHHPYLIDVFGVEYFGTLNGIASLIAAIVGFVSYPLQLFALSTSFSLSFIPIGVIMALCIAFPFILKRYLVIN